MAQSLTTMSSSSNVRPSREALRASVLDAAIEFGIGNETVAKWIFEPVNEDEEEDEEVSTHA